MSEGGHDVEQWRRAGDGQRAGGGIGGQRALQHIVLEGAEARCRDGMGGAGSRHQRRHAQNGSFHDGRLVR